MPDITSLQNEYVKNVVKLRLDKRERQQLQETVVEGRYELELALLSGHTPHKIFACDELISERPNGLRNIKITTVSRNVFEKMSYRDNPDGWLAIFPIPEKTIPPAPISEKPFFVLIDGVEKPGNIGAILRSADGAGVDCCLVCDPRVDLYNPNVIRASRGTIFTVPTFEMANLDAFQYLKAHHIPILAATPQADTSYASIDLSRSICVAVGAEDVGLSDFWIKNADYTVRIPMLGRVNSLNVSTSLAIILYEVVRQRLAG